MRFRATATAAVALALAAAGVAAVAVMPAASAAGTCAATYSVVNDWGSGFQIGLNVTASSALTGWTVNFTYAGNQTLTQGWSGNWTQSGKTVTVTNASWNGSLGTGASTSLGALFNYSGSNTAPSAVTCTAAGSPTPPPTTAPPTTAPPTTAPPTTAPPTTAPPTTPPPSSPPPTGAAPQLHVSGNKLVDSSGNQVILHGVNRSGTEYMCVQGNAIFDGPNDQASLTAMKSWGKVNAVRVPLNEACWNGESYATAADAGTNYINAIKAYVSLLNSNGMVAILDLHWTDGDYTGPSAGNCGSHPEQEAFCQKPMPDAAQAIPFWTSVANTFKGNNAVIFDLFNEPFASRPSGATTAEGWQCWKSGGTCTGISYQVAGMQQMVNAVRSTGASNVLMLGGEEYSNDLTSWLASKPTDPDNNLVASFHSYNFNACVTQSCWTSQVQPVIASVPVVAGEIGENDCAGSYITPLTAWLESQNTSFLAWAWNSDFACSSGPGLITDYTGTPTNYGAAYKAILQALP
jgi:endoglucanase